MDKLGVDYKLLIAQLINFGLFFFVFKKFLAKPFSDFIGAERKKEETINKSHTEALKREEELTKKEEKTLAAAKKQADEIVANAKKTAEVTRKELIEAAEKDAQAIRERAKKQLEEERNQLQKKAQDKIAEISLFLVNQALKDVLTEDVRKKVTQSILKHSSAKVQIYEN